MIIGAHDMTFLGKATNIKLKRESKGTNTLTFNMPSKYFDSKIGEYVHNEFVDNLFNETKIKLHYRDEWYEFYIKQIQEDKQFKSIMYSYTCEDSFIDELSRTGYEIEFADELNNSVAETGDFMEEILDMSIWDYTPQYNTGDFTEFNEQRFYKIPLSQFGGSISAYPIKLEINEEMFFNEEGNPKDYLKKLLAQNNLDQEYDTWNEAEQIKYVKNLITIQNIFNKSKRTIELGDDMAREREVFWDPYYKDNGFDLLSDENKVTLTGDYIYVPITDLSMIMGTIYEDAYKAIEEPALYGKYGDVNRGYALQPSSENPRGLVQFIFLNNKDEYYIDEAGVLADNDYHYVIPIEEWNLALKNIYDNKTEGNEDNGVIYWTQSYSESAEKTQKYQIKEDKDNELVYTINVLPSSSTIDDLNWYPVYYEGYLESLNDNEVTMARKISVTDRTEYNKNSDMYVTVYNNKSSEYIINDNETLFSDKELEDIILDNKDNDFRVCSKLNTRQILPTLARNLVENGTEITDTNGWEARIQNKNNEEELGTGSYSSLVEINVQPTIQNAITIDEYDLDGSVDDESVSDYYLQLLSPCLNKCLDFSLEGNIQTDYALNFGIISQDKQIEKDKVYAIRMKTGDIEITGATFKYRAPNVEESEITETNDIEDKVNKYKNTFKKYKYMFDSFSGDINNAITNMKEKLNLTFNKDEENEVTLFYEIINTWPAASDTLYSDKIKMVDQLLYYILFGGEDIKIWGDNITDNDKENLSYKKWGSGKLNGIINLYDKGKTNKYDKFSSIAINTFEKSSSGQISYKSSDIKYLKYYLYWHISSNKITSNTSYLSASSEQLTNLTIQSWIEQYIYYDKVLNKDKLNNDLDKIVIGEGAINIDGNYTVQGTDDETDYEENFISFSKIFELEDIIVIPSNNNKEGIESIKSPFYHKKNNDNQWSWDTQSGGDYKVEIKDEPFLIFKANKTIKNPYIAIRLDSGPLEIIFDSIQKSNYGKDDLNGVQFNIVDNIENPYYYDNVPIKLIPVSTLTCSDEFLEKIGFDIETSNFNKDSLNDIEWKDDYLKSSYDSWSATSSAENPAYCSVFLKNSSGSMSIPYLLFLNDIYSGIIYLTKE